MISSARDKHKWNAARCDSSSLDFVSVVSTGFELEQLVGCFWKEKKKEEEEEEEERATYSEPAIVHS
jgi:hypothetical protein